MPTVAQVDMLHRELSTAVILFQEAISRQLGVSAAERKCLSVLWDLGVATPGQLLAATGLSSGAITGIVDRLERAGYARREPNPNDRRSLLIHPLRQAELARKIGPAFEGLRGAMEQVIGSYTDAERALIQRHLRATIAVLREQTEAMSAPKRKGREAKPAA
ncbi:MAG: MarR family transcriptional regulator [Sphingomonas sp.]|nr:MarR family transcriptional regulator [Sphingomonas sp.]